jgi:hypothetical protein
MLAAAPIGPAQMNAQSLALCAAAPYFIAIG